MQFTDIPGLTELKGQLISAHKRGKVAHAQLFAGIPGTSALAMAKAYSSYLFCQNPTDHDSCGTCVNCQRIKKNIHPDIHFYFPKISAAESKYDKVLAEAMPLFRSFLEKHPFGDFNDWVSTYGQDNKNLLISREDSRQMLKQVSMRSVEGGYKVLIIWCPEAMNVSSANAILKILEEPPEKTIYFLVSYNYENLLTTITSRSQLVNIPLNTDEEISEYLINENAEKHNAENLARISDGKIGLALQLLDEDDQGEFKEFQRWMRLCYANDITGLVEKSELFSKLGRANMRNELEFNLALVRSSIIHLSSLEINSPNEEEKAFVSKFSNRVGSERLEKIYFLINRVVNNLERNANPKISHLNLSLDIIKIIKN